MGSVQTQYKGRLASREAQDRLARRICLIGEAVHPALDVTWRAVDTVLPKPVLVRVPDTECGFAEIGDVHVVGAELTLTDFRRDWHRFPFTFVREIGQDHLVLPDLDGLLVTVEDREECRLYMSPRIQEAQCFLLSYGTQHLRYDLEPEFDLLMAYVRCLHMPDLTYWRYETIPHFNAYRHWVDELKELYRGTRTISDAHERLGKHWSNFKPTEWDRLPIADDVRQRLEKEGTVEAIATGVLITLLRRAHCERVKER